MHGTEKKEFRCVCGLVLWSENALVNHSKACTRERERRRKERGDARSVGKNSQRTTSRGTEERALREREMEVSGVTSGSRRDRQRRPVQGCTARNGRTAPSADSSSRQRTWHGTGPHVLGEGETDGGAFLGRGERPRRRRIYFNNNYNILRNNIIQNRRSHCYSKNICNTSKYRKRLTMWK